MVDPPKAACTTIALWTDGIGENVAHRQAARFQRQHARADRRAISSQIGWPEGASAGVRQRHAQRFADHLRSGRRAQELAASAGRGAGAAEIFRGGFERDLVVRKARAHRLHPPGVLALFGQQRHAAGHQHAGKVVHRGERHHHGRQSFIAGGHPDHAPARGQRADQAAEDGGGVVAIGQAVEHAGRALRAAVAGVGAVRGEGNRADARSTPSAAASISSPTSQWPV